MSRLKLDAMETANLVDLFRDVALEQDHALLRDDITRVNRLFDRLEDIEAELKTRPGDQRRALLDLYTHPNPQVRVKAIKATLAVAPERARRALEALADSREYPQSGKPGCRSGHSTGESSSRHENHRPDAETGATMRAEIGSEDSAGGRSQSWFQTRVSEFGGLSPRDYLRGRGWNERHRVGLRALIRFGVLLP